MRGSLPILSSLGAAAAFAGFVLVTLPGRGVAQDRDFLTAEEADKIREAQEPNLRLETYLEFAQLRIDQLSQLLAQDRPGRSALVHDLLEDYTSIIVAIDTVADDALSRKVDIEAGMSSAVARESTMLTSLREFQDSNPPDFSRFEFVLGDAIATTEDSIELSEEDLGVRASEIIERERRQQAEREAAYTPEEAKERQAAKDREAKSKRKAPTLRRPGDPPPRFPQPDRPF